MGSKTIILLVTDDDSLLIHKAPFSNLTLDDEATPMILINVHFQMLKGLHLHSLNIIILFTLLHRCCLLILFPTWMFYYL